MSEAQKHHGSLYKAKKTGAKPKVAKSPEEEAAGKLRRRNIKWKSVLKKELKAAGVKKAKGGVEIKPIVKAVVKFFASRPEYEEFDKEELVEVAHLKLSKISGFKVTEDKVLWKKAK